MKQHPNRLWPLRVDQQARRLALASPNEDLQNAKLESMAVASRCSYNTSVAATSWLSCCRRRSYDPDAKLYAVLQPAGKCIILLTKKKYTGYLITGVTSLARWQSLLNRIKEFYIIIRNRANFRILIFRGRYVDINICCDSNNDNQGEEGGQKYANYNYM